MTFSNFQIIFLALAVFTFNFNRSPVDMFVAGVGVIGYSLMCFTVMWLAR